MNRELRRLQAKEEKRARDKRKQVQTRRKKERTGFRQFFSEVRTELKRVAWPNRREVITFTTVTLITAGFVTAFTFGLDVLFKEGILTILELR